jgi:hypothetical protein
MKKILLPLIMIIAFGYSAQAQSKMDDAAVFTANHICNCINIVYKDLESMLAASDDQMKGFDDCMNSINAQMEEKFAGLELEPGFTEEGMFMLMVKKLETIEGCTLAHDIMQMGISTEGDDDLNLDIDED